MARRPKLLLASIRFSDGERFRMTWRDAHGKQHTNIVKGATAAKLGRSIRGDARGEPPERD